VGLVTSESLTTSVQDGRARHSERADVTLPWTIYPNWLPWWKTSWKGNGFIGTFASSSVVTSWWWRGHAI